MVQIYSPASPEHSPLKGAERQRGVLSCIFLARSKGGSISSQARELLPDLDSYFSSYSFDFIVILIQSGLSNNSVRFLLQIVRLSSEEVTLNPASL